MKTLALLVLGFTTACQGEGNSPEPTDAGAPECRNDSDCASGNPDRPSDRPLCNTNRGECVACLSLTDQNNRVLALGCERADECLENRCVAVVETCHDGATDETTGRNGNCQDDRPYCALGECQQCRTASDCPYFGEGDLEHPSCYAVRCNVGVCTAENVCTCESSAECNDGEDCTTDICEASLNTCVHAAIPNCPTASTGGTTGGGGTTNPPPPPATITANCTWTPPSGTGTFSSATMSLSVAGGPMTDLCSQGAGTSITCTRTGLSPSQTLDVSVSYVAGGTTSWSCTGNGSSGSARGTLSCTLSTGATLSSWTPVANGLSGGCNLRTSTPAS